MKENEILQNNKIEKRCQNYNYAYNTGCNKFKKIGNRLEKQSYEFKSEANNKIFNKPNFKRGEIIIVDFGINMGSELSNTYFAIALNIDDNNSVDILIVIPLTSNALTSSTI